MKILNQQQIERKIQRLAYQILENNYEEGELILAGINNNGMEFAQMLFQKLGSISSIKLILTQIRLNPANPLSEAVTIDLKTEDLNEKVIIIIDDVANTGRTIFYACKPVMEALPKKLEVAVLVDRKHKSFPVRVDYLGLSLATTLMENIRVDIKEPADQAVFLE